MILYSLANGELLDAPNTSPEPCAKEMTDENVVPLKNCRRPENSKSDQFEFYEIPKDPKGVFEELISHLVGS